MGTTMQLLTKALEIKRASRWSEELDIDVSTIAQAKKRGRLSPTLAGTLAIELGENPTQWMAVAAMEAEQDSPLLTRLKDRSKQWLHS